MFFQSLPSTRRGFIDHFMRSLLGYFKPSSVWRGALQGIAPLRDDSVFNPRPSHRGRPSRLSEAVLLNRIAIHPLHMEGDCGWMAPDWHGINFNPPPPCRRGVFRNRSCGVRLKIYQSTICKNSSSVRIWTPSCCAFVSLLPASSPART